MEGRVAREKGAGDVGAHGSRSTHGRKRCHRCFRSPRYRSLGTKRGLLDGMGLEPKRFLSRGIVVVYSVIGNGNSKFPPDGIFSDSPKPISDLSDRISGIKI